jgi:hypothetical protein
VKQLFREVGHDKVTKKAQIGEFGYNIWPSNEAQKTIVQLKLLIQSSHLKILPTGDSLRHF